MCHSFVKATVTQQRQHLKKIIICVTLVDIDKISIHSHMHWSACAVGIGKYVAIISNYLLKYNPFVKIKFSALLKYIFFYILCMFWLYLFEITYIYMCCLLWFWNSMYFILYLSSTQSIHPPLSHVAPPYFDHVYSIFPSISEKIINFPLFPKKL